jgi:hypothetical protein
MPRGMVDYPHAARGRVADADTLVGAPVRFIRRSRSFRGPHRQSRTTLRDAAQGTRGNGRHPGGASRSGGEMRVTLRQRSTVVLALLFAACVAQADPPTVTYSPVPDQKLPDGSDCATASGNPTFEVNFGSCAQDEDGRCTITATSNEDGGASPTDVTVIGCEAVTSSGDGTIEADSGSGIQFTGSDPGSGEIKVSCAPGSQNTVGRVCCTEVRLNTQTTIPFWDVNCPTTANPEFTSDPAANATITMSAVVGSSSTSPITVTNDGTGNLSVTPSGLESPPLSIAPSTTTSIAASQVFTLTCAPNEVGSAQQLLTFQTNDADEGLVTYTVQCSGTAAPAPNIGVTPTPPGPLSIAAVQPNDQSASFSVANSGNATLNVTSITGLDPPFSVSPPSATVNAGGPAAQFNVSCDAATPGSFSDTLTINNNDPDTPAVALNVDCAVTSPEFDSTPAAPGPIGLAAVTGTTAPTATITVQNAGTASLTVSSIGETTPGGPITVAPANAAIAPSSSQGFVVSCSTAAPGSFTDTLTFNTNDVDEPAVQFSVTCDISAAMAPEYSSAPAAPGPVSIVTDAGVSGSASITISNVGTANLSVSSLTEGTPGGVITVSSPSLPGTINPGSMATVTVNCSNASAGSFNDTLTVATNDTNEASVLYNLGCTVNAIPSSPEFSSAPAAPGPLNIAATQGAASGTNTITVTNTGNASLNIASITGLSAPLSVSPLAGAIGPGGSVAFVVSCATGTPGTFNRTMTFNTNDPDDGESAVTFNVSCTVAQAAPVFFSTPASGSALPTLSGPVATDTDVRTNVVIENDAPTGALDMTSTPSGLSGSLSLLSSATQITPPGGSDTLTVRCRPTSVATTTRTLSLDTNAANVDPATYTATCVGTAGPEIGTLPAPVIKGNVYSFSTKVGSSTSALLQVTNSGSAPLRVFGTTGLAAPFSITPNIDPRGTPLTINPGTTANFTVRCTGTVVGTFSDTLTLSNNDINESSLLYGMSCKVGVKTATLRAVRVIMSTDDFHANPLFMNGFETESAFD